MSPHSLLGGKQPLPPLRRHSNMINIPSFLCDLIIPSLTPRGSWSQSSCIFAYRKNTGAESPPQGLWLLFLLAAAQWVPYSLLSQTRRLYLEGSLAQKVVIRKPSRNCYHLKKALQTLFCVLWLVPGLCNCPNVHAHHTRGWT